MMLQRYRKIKKSVTSHMIMFLKGRAASVRLIDTNEIVKHFFPVKLTSLSSVYIDKGLQACKWIFFLSAVPFFVSNTGKPDVLKIFQHYSKKTILVDKSRFIDSTFVKFPLQ